MFFTSLVCPSTVPDSMQPISITRPKTWASGMNSSVDALASNRSGTPSTVLSTSKRRFEWVRMQPLGRPVVPEV